MSKCLHATLVLPNARTLVSLVSDGVSVGLVSVRVFGGQLAHHSAGGRVLLHGLATQLYRTGLLVLVQHLKPRQKYLFKLFDKISVS